MSRRMPEVHFAFVWSLVTVMAMGAALPLDVYGVSWWPIVANQLATGGLLLFVGAEWVAGGVRRGYSATYTAWVFYHISNTVLRVTFGYFLAVTLLLRLDWRGPLDEVIGWGMLGWLPWHYIHRRFKGPIDRLVIWVGRSLGLDKWLDQITTQPEEEGEA